MNLLLMFMLLEDKITILAQFTIIIKTSVVQSWDRYKIENLAPQFVDWCLL